MEEDLDTVENLDTVKEDGVKEIEVWDLEEGVETAAEAANDTKAEAAKEADEGDAADEGVAGKRFKTSDGDGAFLGVTANPNPGCF